MLAVQCFVEWTAAQCFFVERRRSAGWWNAPGGTVLRHQIVNCRRLVIGNRSNVGYGQTKQAGKVKKSRPGQGKFFLNPLLGEK
jgi:hypothetical protein